MELDSLARFDGPEKGEPWIAQKHADSNKRRTEASEPDSGATQKIFVANPCTTFSNNRGFLINLRASCCGFEAAWRAGASDAFMARGYSSPLGGSNAPHFGATLP